MIKNLISALCITFLGTIANAQILGYQDGIIDWDEDSTKLVTYNDIVRQQQEKTTQEGLLKNNDKVWGHRTFFNISYNLSASLAPVLDKDVKGIPTGLNIDGFKYVETFKRDWGLSLKWGKNIRLHKKALANIFQFNIDYVWADLNVNHYKAVVCQKENEQEKIFDSRNKEGGFYYFPWNLEKYNFTYGMFLGPSITIAPFTHIKNSRNLNYIKFNFYYHIGYNIAFMLCSGDEEFDMNPKPAKDFTNASKTMFGHGLAHAVGFNVSWKKIGLGWETHFGNVKYKSMGSEIFGPDKYTFRQSDSRIYLQLRF